MALARAAVGAMPTFADNALVLDLEHLSQFSMGDRALERRFLALFVEHAGVALAEMFAASPDQLRRVAHSLQSSASSVGAWRIVSLTQEVMGMRDEALRSCKSALLEELANRVEEAVGHVHRVAGT
jgi:hypothetical protein